MLYSIPLSHYTVMTLSTYYYSFFLSFFFLLIRADLMLVSYQHSEIVMWYIQHYSILKIIFRRVMIYPTPAFYCADVAGSDHHHLDKSLLKIIIKIKI